MLRAPESQLTDTVPAAREPTIHDLSRNTAGHKYGGDAYEKANLYGLDTRLAEMVTRLAKIPLYDQPGAHFEYSVGQDMQARLVEIFSGVPFDRMNYEYGSVPNSSKMEAESEHLAIINQLESRQVGGFPRQVFA